MSKQPKAQPAPTRITAKQLADAAEDANLLMQESATLQQLVFGLILSKRIYALLRNGIDMELTQHWEVSRADIIAGILTQSAHDKANDPTAITSVADLCDKVDKNLVPILAIFKQMEADHAASVLGSGNNTPSELGDVPYETEGDTDDKAGVASEGN